MLPPLDAFSSLVVLVTCLSDGQWSSPAFLISWCNLATVPCHIKNWTCLISSKYSASRGCFNLTLPIINKKSATAACYSLVRLFWPLHGRSGRRLDFASGGGWVPRSGSGDLGGWAWTEPVQGKSHWLGLWGLAQQRNHSSLCDSLLFLLACPWGTLLHARMADYQCDGNVGNHRLIFWALDVVAWYYFISCVVRRRV